MYGVLDPRIRDEERRGERVRSYPRVSKRASRDHKVHPPAGGTVAAAGLMLILGGSWASVGVRSLRSTLRSFHGAQRAIKVQPAFLSSSIRVGAVIGFSAAVLVMIVCAGTVILAVKVLRRHNAARHVSIVLFIIFGLISLPGAGSGQPLRVIAPLANLAVAGLLLLPSSRRDVQRLEEARWNQRFGDRAPMWRPAGIGYKEPAGREETAELNDSWRSGTTSETHTRFQLFGRRFVRNKLAVGALLVFVVLSVGLLLSRRVYDTVRFDPVAGQANPRYPASARPSFAHPFGLDPFGRDHYTRTIEGARQSVKIGLGTGLLSGVIGVTIGALAGYYGGRTEGLLMRATDLVLLMPPVALLAVLSRFGAKLPIIGSTLAKRDGTSVLIILSLFLWTAMARLVRSEFLSLRERPFVEAARALGGGDARIMLRHMLPNATGIVIVQTTLVVARAVVLESTLSFLGLGLAPPATSLGVLIREAASAYPWELVFPGLFAVTIILCINFISDGLHDALDPAVQLSIPAKIKSEVS
jgi:peptide/nickel transport system permease protein